jgi:hypothetical protein
MPYIPYLSELSPILGLAQVALTIWMLVDANQRGVEYHWFWIILLLQPIGAWVYFVMYKMKDYQGRGGWPVNLFHPRPSLSELRHRAEQSPTPAHWLELGERLVEEKAFAEAAPHLEAVLAREPDHCRCLFLMAQAHRGMAHPTQAIPLLKRILARQSNWGDYRAWEALVEVCEEAGDSAEALAQCRELARVAPTLKHKCLLADYLVETGATAEAGKMMREALEVYRYAPRLSRRRDRRWVGKARQLLREVDGGR